MQWPGLHSRDRYGGLVRGYLPSFLPSFSTAGDVGCPIISDGAKQCSGKKAREAEQDRARPTVLDTALEVGRIAESESDSGRDSDVRKELANSPSLAVASLP